MPLVVKGRELVQQQIHSSIESTITMIILLFSPTVAGGYEMGVQVLRQQHSEDMAKVVQDIFSHYYITGRNALAIKLIEALQNEETYNMSDNLKKMLSQLASLNNHKNSKVALAARQVCV